MQPGHNILQYTHCNHVLQYLLELQGYYTMIAIKKVLNN